MRTRRPGEMGPDPMIVNWWGVPAFCAFWLAVAYLIARCLP